jgi:anti-sigma regulatory factor (Ser/Thr protein kinase)
MRGGRKLENFENERSFSVVPNQESISRVSEFLDGCVEEFEIPMRVGYSLKVVADEIYSNIVYYSGAKNAEVLFRNLADSITLIFVDDGMPYNPMETKEPDITASAEDREIGGLGLFMVKKMAEDVRYEYASEHNRLTVILSKTVKKKKMSLEDFDI